MKILADLFPIILFFIAYKLGDIYLATLVAILASGVQVLWSRYKNGRFEKLPLITLATLIVLGGATLILRNELFIKWKPTAIYWVLASAFLISQFIGKRPIIQRLIEQNISLPNRVWQQLNISWAIFFVLLGCANLYVVYNFDTNTWVNFKLFGTMGLTILFIIAQGIYISRHQKPVLESEQ